MTQKAQRYLPHDDRKQAIAEAARALIVEKGFEGLRTRDIAERVGINIATLHYHVPSKDALIELVARSISEEFIELARAFPTDGLDPVGRLRQEFARFRATRETRPGTLTVLEELGRRARHDENVRRHIDPLKGRWHQIFVSILGDGRAAGQFRADLDPDACALMIIGALVTSHKRPTDRFLETYDAVTAELIRAVMAPGEKGT